MTTAPPQSAIGNRQSAISKLSLFAADIKISHTIFALPWALLSTFLAAREKIDRFTARFRNFVGPGGGCGTGIRNLDALNEEERRATKLTHAQRPVADCHGRTFSHRHYRRGEPHTDGDRAQSDPGTKTDAESKSAVSAK